MSEPLESQVARHSEWIEGHEKRCEDRYEGIKEIVGDLKSTMKGWEKAIWAAVVALLGWAATQVYANLKEASQPIYAPPAISDRP